MKKIIISLFIFTILIQTSVKSQFLAGWSDSFQYTSTDFYSNEGREVVVDNAGNVFTILDASADIDPAGNITTTTNYYTVIQKYDITGNMVAGQRIEVGPHYITGFDGKSAFGLELDGAGNVYFGYGTNDAGTGYNVTILKLDNDLNPLWAHIFKPSTDDIGVSLRVTAAGTAYALVKSIAGPTTTMNIIKANGNNITSIPHYGLVPNNDVINNITTDLNENVYFTGYALVSGFKNILAGSVSSAGNLRWKRIYNAGSVARDDFAKNLIIGSSGELFVTGTSDRGAPANNNVIVLAFSSNNGKLIWESFVDNNNGNDNGEYIYVYDSKHVYVGSVSGNNILINRFYASNGVMSGKGTYTPVPESQYTSITKLEFTHMQLMSFPDENIYLAGTLTATNAGQQFKSAFLSRFDAVNGARNPIQIKKEFEHPVNGTFTESLHTSGLNINNSSGEVYWLKDYINNNNNHQREIVLLNEYLVPPPLKIENPADITENSDLSSFIVDIYPNPAGNLINISSNQTVEKIEILDYLGKVIAVYTISSTQKTELNLSGIDNGFYFIRAFSSTGAVLQSKFTKL